MTFHLLRYNGQLSSSTSEHKYSFRTVVMICSPLSYLKLIFTSTVYFHTKFQNNSVTSVGRAIPTLDGIHRVHKRPSLDNTLSN